MTGIRTAEERNAHRTMSCQIWAGPKVGKTFLASTLPADETLVINAEDGLSTIANHPVDDWPISNWAEFEKVVSGLARRDPSKPSKYKHLFIDSVTRIADSYAWTVAKENHANFSDRGNFMALQAYKQVCNMMDWAWEELHKSPFNVWSVGGLKWNEPEGKAGFWSPEMPGSSARGAPYHFDVITTMVIEKGGKRKLITDVSNIKKYPAGSRFDALDATEEPNLSAIYQKCLFPTSD